MDNSVDRIAGVENVTPYAAVLPIELVPMSRPAPPALTIRYDGSTRTFAAGNDVVIGRDLRADVRIAHPLISRAHLVLRFDQGRWVAIDNGSLNGMYVNGRRVPAVDIQDGQQITIGNPDGPGLTFEVGRHQGSVGMTPKTMTVSLPPRSGSPRPSALPPTGRPPVHPPSTSRPSTPRADVSGRLPVCAAAEVPLRASVGQGRLSPEHITAGAFAGDVPTGTRVGRPRWVRPRRHARPRASSRRAC